MEAHVPDNTSWIINAIMQHCDDIHQNQVWLKMLNAPKFSMKKMYMAVHDRAQSVVWRTLFYGNVTRPRALVNLWLACHESETKGVWRKILEWIQIDHNPLGWRQEVEWIFQQSKGKGGHAKILKLAFTESVYEIWRYRNDVRFGNVVHTYQHTH
ncbi:hypothetical protein TSUD_27760 [Trifolium subterraneum]|uniref:Reverse transcriptase zinc-binding domain-containing protein n=1 Tax=Trifolium subterraneum TaxID=3900 RepID=A0A2Z6NU09_TRISU|nr:hypothetical protein TSUD_27760 [Trifolium subterraneum]